MGQQLSLEYGHVTLISGIGYPVFKAVNHNMDVKNIIYQVAGSYSS